MKINEAIKELNAVREYLVGDGRPEEQVALKLGMAALNRLVDRRGFAIPADLNLLPGETKD